MVQRIPEINELTYHSFQANLVRKTGEDSQEYKANLVRKTWFLLKCDIVKLNTSTKVVYTDLT